MPAKLLFVAGDQSQVGKSTVCLGLLDALLTAGFTPAEVAYIKPATQCESDQLVAKYCRARGIACVPIGPIVFFPGFTRAFLAGETHTSQELLAQAASAVSALAADPRKVVIVDGVGYPAVGSVCGVSNADIAATLNAPVLLVGRKGVGDAIDSYNMNASFFTAARVRVLGAVFNKVPDDDSYYSLNNCKTAVTSYFEKSRPSEMPYGFLPALPILAGTSAPPPLPSSNETAAGTRSTGIPSSSIQLPVTLTTTESAAVAAVGAAFSARVDLPRLLADIGVPLPVVATPTVESEARAVLGDELASNVTMVDPSGPVVDPSGSVLGADDPSDAPAALKKSRLDIEAAAKQKGACGG